MAGAAVIPLLVTMMLVTGVCNTLLTKFQDIQCVRNCNNPDPDTHKTFEQPVIQTVQMFMGETGCWLVVLGFYLYKVYLARTKQTPFLYQPIPHDDHEDDTLHPVGSRTSQDHAHPAAKALVPNADDRVPLSGWKLTLLALPACCDIIGTTLMNVGLLFVAASIYQMTRGALVLFVGLFSVLFLKRKLFLYHWFSLFIVVIGVGLVGLAGAIFKGDKNPHSLLPTDPDENNAAAGALLTHSLPLTFRDLATRAAPAPEVLHTILGILLIAFAQIFTATQFCLEEWILEHYALEPLKVVSWEGVFGLVVTLVGQLLLHYTVGISPAGHHGYFDAAAGYREILTNRTIALSSVAIMVSIGGFNFFGLSVTRTISATSRSIIDTCRTLFIWIVSLGLGWESFKWLQVLGFALLVYGTFLFNDLVTPPIRACLPRPEERVGRRPELLEEEPIEHM